MTDWDDVLEITDSTVPPTVDDQLLVISGEDDRSAVVARIQHVFGCDESRSSLRLLVDGDDRGVLRREDAYGLAQPSDRGTLGIGDHLTLPGYSVEHVVLRLSCRAPGCHVHASVVSVPDDPPRCPLHQQPLTVSG